MSLSRYNLLTALALCLAGAAVAQPPDLARSGWTFIAQSDGTDVFMRHDGAAAGVMRKVWTAYELGEARDRGGFSFRSVKSLGEYDCDKRRTRVLAETFHAEPGLSGKDWAPEAFVVTDWAEPAPGSVGDLRMEFACPGAAKTPVPA